MAEMITRYLAGTGIEFQYTLTDEDGVETSLFHDYEQEHMADCLALYVLCRKILLASALGFVAMLALLWLLRNVIPWLWGFLTGLGLVLACVAVLLVWGCVDFGSLFVLFHHVAFTNSLWLLNPSTDLLIRLMPTNFFVSFAAGIAICWLAVLLAAGAVAGVILKKQKNKRRRSML